MNYFLKSAALLILGSPAMLRRRLRLIAGSGALTILNFHRVAGDDESSYRPMDPFMFEALVTFLQPHFQFTTFAELDSNQASARPKLILSFDDGYKDFIDVAVPILDRLKVRVNQNVIPECIETGLPPLNVVAQDFIGQAPEELLKAFSVPGLETKNLVRNRDLMGLRVSAFLKNRRMTEQRSLAEDLWRQFSNYQEFKPTAMLSLNEVRQLASAHELGAHSYSHASMAFETPEFLENDLTRCRQYFRDSVGTDTKIYAFPNGSCNDSQIRQTRAAGFEHVLLVNDAFSRPHYRVHPRFGIQADTDREARYRALGGYCELQAAPQGAP